MTDQHPPSPCGGGDGGWVRPHTSEAFSTPRP
nr:MAG TPA: hypothetical protein [Caudoviricetes sp.]